MTSLPAPPDTDVDPPVDPVDVVTDTSARFATHLSVLAHQLGEHGLTSADRKDSPALAELRDHLTAWEDAGRPGPEQFALIASPCEGGWQVRAILP
ncbi:hypothetical protein [Streptosporangium sandarakinum]|uniref:hypothetical protein n=1 Tax=Streptosporangium sandarakinum TaxID=1260955 RepID=UPI0037186716